MSVTGTYRLALSLSLSLSIYIYIYIIPGIVEGTEIKLMPTIFTSLRRVLIAGVAEGFNLLGLLDSKYGVAKIIGYVDIYLPVDTV